MKKRIMDLLVETLNEELTEEQRESGDKWERLHSEPYQIVQTENGIFHNPIKKSKASAKMCWGLCIFVLHFVLHS